MKNNKEKLLVEIFRQTELMGIKKILTEGEGIVMIKELFNISNLHPNYNKLFEEAIEDLKTSHPNLIKNIETNIGLSSNELSFANLKKYASNITSVKSQSLDDLLEQVTSSIKKIIYSGKNQEYNDLADLIIDESLKNFPNSRKAYYHLVEIAETGTREELDSGIAKYGQYLDKDIINYLYQVKLVGRDITEDIYDSIAKKFGDAWAVTVKGWDKIKIFGSYLVELTKQNSILEGIFTSQPISGMAKLLRLKSDKFLPNTTEIKQMMQDVFGRISDKFEKGLSTGSSTDIQKEIDELTAIYSKFLSRKNESHKMIYDSWMVEFKRDPRLKRLFSEKRMVEKLDANGLPVKQNGKIVYIEEIEPFYIKNWKDPKFLEMIDAIEKAKGTDIQSVHQTYSKIQGSIRMVKEMGGTLKLTKIFTLNYWYNWLSLVQRLAGTFLFYGPNTLKELSHNKRVLGFKRWVGLGIGQKIVTSVVWVPTLLSVYKTIGSGLQDMYNARKEAMAKEGQNINDLKAHWWLLNDDEWSEMMGKNAGNEWLTFGQLFMKNFGDFSIFNTKELATKPAAWSLAAYTFLNYHPKDFKPSDVVNQINEVTNNSRVELDTLNQMGQNDPELRKILDSLKVPTYEDLNNKIDSSLKDRPKINGTKDIEY